VEKRPEKGANVIRKIIWTGTFKRKFVGEYRRWMIEQVDRVLCEEWQTTLHHCFRVGQSQWENWLFEPGVPPMLASYSTMGPSEPVEEETEHVFSE
jgi:hypothetical protein